MLESVLGECIVMYIRNFLQNKKRKKNPSKKKPHASRKKTLEFSQTHSIMPQLLTMLYFHIEVHSNAYNQKQWWWMTINSFVAERGCT